MKISLTVSIILLFLFSCDEEVNRPAFQTLPVSELSDQGVNFNGKISLTGNEKVTNYGFVWATNTTPDVEQDSAYSFNEPAVAGPFTKRITDGLTSGTEYFVRAFVTTTRTVYYSNSVKFESLGSATPVISSFNPGEGATQEEVTLVGQHFSPDPGDNEVMIGSFPCTVVSASPTELVVKLPYTYNTGSYKFSVTVDGKTGISSTDFLLKGPVVHNITPTVGPAGITMTIVGSSFSTTPTNNIVLFDDIRAYVNSATETELNVTVPHINQAGSKTVSVQVGAAMGICPVKFNLTGPTITAFSPTTGIQGTLVTITGTGFSSVPAENRVILGSHFGWVEVISSSPEQLVMKIPSVEFAGKTKVLVEVKSIYAEAPDEFTIEGPEITNVDPTSQYGGRTITLTGKNFDPISSNNFVTFANSKQGEIISGNTTSLIVRVPYDLAVSAPIELRTGNIKFTTPYPFNLLSPWEKLQDFPGGERSGAVSFTIGSIAYVGMGISAGGDRKDFWQYNPATNSWTKKADYPGPSRAYSFSFVVNGKAYIGGGGHYGYSEYDLKNKFYDLWEFDPATDSWTQKQSFSPNNLSDQQIVATGIGSYGYFTANNFLYRYDPANDQWWIFNNSFPYAHSYRNVSMTVGSKGYFSPGRNYGPGPITFWEFDPAANTWTQMPDSPVDFGFFFVVGSKIYVGSSQYFYEFDTVAKQWKQLPTMPGYFGGMATFGLGAFGYVVTGLDGTPFDFVYRFDPNY